MDNLNRAWIERRYVGDEMVHETVNLQPMPEDHRKRLEQHYRLEVIELAPVERRAQKGEGEAGELPDPAVQRGQEHDDVWADQPLYTTDQMREYGKACARAAVAARQAEPVDERTPIAGNIENGGQP